MFTHFVYQYNIIIGLLVITWTLCPASNQWFRCCTIAYIPTHFSTFVFSRKEPECMIYYNEIFFNVIHIKFNFSAAKKKKAFEHSKKLTFVTQLFSSLCHNTMF